MIKSKHALALMVVAGGLTAAMPGVQRAHAECDAERIIPTCGTKSTKKDKCKAKKG